MNTYFIVLTTKHGEDYLSEEMSEEHIEDFLRSVSDPTAWASPGMVVSFITAGGARLVIPLDHTMSVLAHPFTLVEDTVDNIEEWLREGQE